MAGTAKIEQRVAELERLLRSSLERDPRIRFESLKISAPVPPLDLGPLANPVPALQWADFEPARPNALGRILGGGQRYQASHEEAQRAFAGSAKPWHSRHGSSRAIRIPATQDTV